MSSIEPDQNSRTFQLSLLADEAELNSTYLSESEQNSEQYKNSSKESKSNSNNASLFHHFKADTTPKSQNKRSFSKLVSLPTTPSKSGETERKPHISSPHGTPSKCKRCNCKNSRCLQSYCICFSASVYCSDCNCEGCFNTTQNETLVEEARRHALDRDPTIFESKIYSNDSNLNKKGCKCTKTNCLKKYCECFRAGKLCGDFCKCTSCSNCKGNDEIINLKRQKIEDNIKDQNFHYLTPEKVKVSLALYTQNKNGSSKVLDEIFNKVNLKELANSMFESTIFNNEKTAKQEERIVLELLSDFFDKSISKIKSIKSKKENLTQ